MSIVKLIEKHRPPFYLTHITQSVLNDDNTIHQGFLIEKYVRDWLKLIEELNINPTFPKQKWIYILEKKQFGQILGINFFSGGGIFEFDGLIEWQNKIYPYEVKSNKLNGYRAKIPDYLEIIKTIFPTQKIGKLLIFCNMDLDRSSSTKNRLVKEHNHEIDFIHLGYTKKNLHQFIEQKEKNLTNIT